ncbi:ATP-dependent RNA helicase ROK1 [Pseudozyma hubeiensis]|nr:ATP-dependent RNA helicase ROK1 [Pseudozyma hubeiensis]
MSNSIDDEFDSLFDDGNFLDPELEESLAQAEATYTASQAVQQHAQSSSMQTAQPTTSVSSFRNQSDTLRPARRIGTFVQPPAKKQRLDPGPSNLGRSAARFPEPEPDEVIVRNLREEEFGDNDDEHWWAGNNALDQVEEEAIRMSQQMPTSQPHASHSRPNQPPPRMAPDKSRTSSVSHKPPDSTKTSRDPATSRSHPDNEELERLRAEVEQLRAAQKAQEETVDRLKQEAYRKSGEVAVVRQNLTKLNAENSKLREREVVREQEHRAALERLQKDQERRLQRLETETAFRRVEQDTSRRIWPSSVARLPASGLRDVVDRRQENQVRAGLTTPTKANRYGVRGGSGSSGTRQRYVDTANDREEPGTPTRSAVKPAPHFPRPPTAATSASKKQAFRGLQNSFADFGPVQEKIRQQKQSPAKTSKAGALPPADWDMDQSRAMGASEAAHDDTLMDLDEGPPPGPSRKILAQREAGSGRPDQRREHMYLAAVSEILSRRNTIVSILLSHSSVPAAVPTSFPSNCFNPSASRPSDAMSRPAENNGFSTSTLRRLISANLVPDCPDLLLFRYRKAVESLLASLSRAKVLEPEEREDVSRLLSTDSTDHAIEELDFSSATMHLSHAIASSLMIMAGVLLRLCQTDLLTDVMRLVSCLVSTLPRFYLDLECLQADHGAEIDEIAFLGGDESVSKEEWSKYATPIHVRDILAQCIDECRHPSTRKSTANHNGASFEHEGGVQDFADAQERNDDLGLGDWDLSLEAREDLFRAVVQVLEAMSQCPDASLSSGHHPLRLLSWPGVLHKLLHPDRSSFIISSVVRMLSLAVSNAPLVHECLASKADGQVAGRGSGHSMAPRANARFPVLELIVKHLVDRRFDMAESEWHALHRVILTFLSQAALRSADTLIVLADSAALLAALIRCLSLDSDFVWLESRPTFMLPPRMPTYRRTLTKASSTAAGHTQTISDASGGNLVQAVERIVMDTRLLNLLYNYPLPNSADHAVHRFEPSSQAGQERMGSISLATKLDQPETYSMLNGIRQSFIVALSRIAFCSEPDWIASERKLLASILPDLRKRAEQAREAIGAENDETRAQSFALTDEELVAEQVEESIRGLDRVSMLLEAIADVAGDLTDIVLSPEEIDSVYELLVSGEEDEDEDAMDVDSVELDRRGKDAAATPLPHSEVVEEEAGSETESEPELDMEKARVDSRKAMSRTSSRASKSVSPTKRDARNGKALEETMDVIEIDDSD